MRPGGEFFAIPADATQRRYEGLRAYLYEDLPAEDAAGRVGWTTTTLHSAVRDFRAGRREFFTTPCPGPKSAPAKDAARGRIVALRRAGHSVYEISEALAGTDTPLNRTGVSEVLAEEGFTRQWPRPHAARGGPKKEPLAAAGVVNFEALPRRWSTKVAGLYLDFHAAMHYGEDPILEDHSDPRRSQRTASVLTFFAQDATSAALVYANADLLKASQGKEVIAFCDHWKKTSGSDPSLVVFDSKLTTHAILAELHARGIRFITLRMRSPKLLASLEALPKEAWKPVSLDRPGAVRTRPSVAEDPAATLSNYPGTIRQLAVRGLGHDRPTIIITNDATMTARAVIGRYAHRMGIEQRLAETIRSFNTDALSSAVPLNVDLDVALSVVASAVCTSLRRRLAGYASATPDTLQRRFLNSPGEVRNRSGEIVVRLDRKTYNPVLRQADLPVTAVPWWGGRTLRFEYS